MKKIGGVMIDEDNYEAMLKKFNSNVPNKSRASNCIKRHTLAPKQESQSDFVKKDIRK